MSYEEEGACCQGLLLCTGSEMQTEREREERERERVQGLCALADREQ